MSALADILDAVKAKETAAAATVGGQALTVVKRKLPKRRETVDAAYQVTVSGAEVPDRVERIAFGGHYKVVYRVEITLVTPGEDAATNLDDHAAWREACRARYQAADPLPTVTAVKRIEVVPAAFLDRSALAEGYDYNQLALELTTYEAR